MRKKFLYTFLLITILSCKRNKIEKPILLNKEKKIILPHDSFSFQTKEKKWKAVLMSFTQPILLHPAYTTNGFTLHLQAKFGITEGPAHLILSSNNQQFIYEVNLINDTTGKITEKDYRSPKTVNPDSSLAIQKIIHSIDEWRNLVYNNQSIQYFKENMISLSPTTGTFRAQAEKPITAFYIQPGSTVNVTVNSTYNKNVNEFIVTAGPLKDKHNNTVANGTKVSYFFTDGENHYRMESTLQNGIAIAKIPNTGKLYKLYAKVNETISPTITLTAK